MTSISGKNLDLFCLNPMNVPILSHSQRSRGRDEEWEGEERRRDICEDSWGGVALFASSCEALSRVLWALLGFPSRFPFLPSWAPFYPPDEASPGASYPTPIDEALAVSDTITPCPDCHLVLKMKFRELFCDHYCRFPCGFWFKKIFLD